MQKYIRKVGGVIVEAAQLNDDNIGEVSNWANGAQIVEEKDALSHAVSEGLNIKTADGMKRRASMGDYVVKVNGEFFVVKPGNFESKYRPIDEPKPAPAMQPFISKTSDPFEGMTRFNEGPKP